MTSSHRYALGLAWEGDRGAGTAGYAGYDRRFRVTIAGKPDLIGSADPAFRGDPALPNPEELMIAAVASCHLLTYLALCARRGVRVLAYDDTPAGELAVDLDGGGALRSITLRPRVTIAAGGDAALAAALHAEAHARCFIARSCRVPITHDARVEVA